MLSTMQDAPLSLGRLLQHATETHAEARAVTWTGTSTRSRTYGEIGRRSAQVAHALTSLGVEPFDRVATFMWNNTEHLEIYAAVPAMGAVLQALNIRLFSDQIVYIAHHAEDSIVFVDGTLAATFAEILPRLRTVRHVIVVDGDVRAIDAPSGVCVYDYEDLLAGQPTTFSFPTMDETSAAALCYTSGTTGDPKGVVYSHRSLFLHAAYVTTPAALNLSAHDTCLAIVPMFHVNGWSLPFAALMSGASLLLPDRHLQPEPLLALMAEMRPTRAAAVPTIWSGLLARLEEHPQDISHLAEAVVGGSAVPPSVMRAFEERHGVSIIHAWGMTETSAISTVARPPAAARGDEAWRYRMTQGRFAPQVAHRLVDVMGEVVPDDGHSIGELQVRGPWVTASYFARSDEASTAQFDDGWLRTGDIAKVTPDGYLTLVDRAKDVIKSGGEWISSVDMEAALMALPSVAEASVIAVKDPKWQERPLACVVLRPGEQLSVAEVGEHLRAHGFARWQLPDRIEVLDEIPRTSVGKFDKKVLRARFDP